MFRSAIFAFAVAVTCYLQAGCCCCVDFVKGFKKGFNQGLQKAQQQQEDQRRANEQADDGKRKADLALLLAQNLGPNGFAGTLAPGSPFWGKLKQTNDQKK